MLKGLIQDIDTFIYTDAIIYGLAALGLCVFVGLYYLGEYLFSDRDPEPDFASDVGE